MKILALIPPGKSPSQISRYSFLSEELTAFADRGSEIHVMSYVVDRKQVVERVTIHPIPRQRKLLHTLSSLRWLGRMPIRMKGNAQKIRLCRVYQSIARVLQREQIDVVYSPFSWPFQTAGLPVATAMGVPVVVSLRGVDALTEKDIGYGRTLDPDARDRMSETLRHADHVIGISEALVTRGIELEAAAENTSVVLKGVDVTRFSQGCSIEAKQKLKLQNAPIVLFTGHLIRRKGADVLLNAFANVLQQFPNAKLVLCGDGPEMASLKAISSELGITSSVFFVGRIERNMMPVYFRACDVFVLPSLCEGAGNVLVEAGACGKPSIGTDVAGIPDYIDDGVTGYLFRKADANDLAEKLITILEDKELATRMGKAARQRVEQRHTYDHMIDQLLGVFQNIIEKRTGVKRVNNAPQTTLEPETA